MPGGFAACMPYGLYILLADIHNSSTVLFYSASARSKTFVGGNAPPNERRAVAKANRVRKP